MTPGQKVGWTLKNGETGTGSVVLVSDSGAHALVAVDPVDPAKFPDRKFAQSSLEFHPTIWCTVTWLTVLE